MNQSTALVPVPVIEAPRGVARLGPPTSLE